MRLEFTLTDDQLEQIAERVAEILADREPAPEMMTFGEAGQMAGVSPRTVANWCSGASPRLTRYGVPRRPLVSRAELLALVSPPAPVVAGKPHRPASTRRRKTDGYFRALAKDDESRGQSA